MFESIMNFFKKMTKKEDQTLKSKDAAKERLHLVLMQDRANVSADFLDLMKQEIIEVIKKYIDVDESAIDVRMTNRQNEDGTSGAPALYANIPIMSIKDDVLREKIKTKEKEEDKIKKDEENKEDKEQEKEEKKDVVENKEETSKEDNKEETKTESNKEETKDENEPAKKEEKVETPSKH